MEYKKKSMCSAEKLNKHYQESKKFSVDKNGFYRVPEGTLQIYRFQCNPPAQKSKYYIVKYNSERVPTTRMNIEVDMDTIYSITPVPENILKVMDIIEENKKIFTEYFDSI